MNIAQIIDHTNLKPDATRADIKKLCDEAKKYGFAAVCVNPCNVAFAARELAQSEVKVCAVCGFPLGANTTRVKVFEAKEAVLDGANEIDMVINIGKLKEKEYEQVLYDIKAVVDAVSCPVKVIIETCLLTPLEIKMACALVKESGAAFIKTSTGFSEAGAKIEDVAFMRAELGDALGIKAAGGIHTFAFAKALIDAGANRIGASKSIEICKGNRK